MKLIKPILVTGGAGYIGSHVCKLLAKSGFQPIVYDNLSTGHKSFVKWGELIVADLLNTKKLIEEIKRNRPIAVIHLAASAYVGESVNNPLKYYKNNVSGTLSLIEAMKFFDNINKIVFSSSCAVYGSPNTSIINENTIPSPINPYGQSKIMVEKVLLDLSKIQEINFISLRYFNASGADKDNEIGEIHSPETHLIPNAIMSGMGGPILKIFGTDFPTDDGTPVRDYIHVEDLAKAHVLAVNYLLDNGSSDIINLGNGRGYSVNEILSAIKSLGVNVQSEYAPRRIGDPPFLVADASKAKRILGWEPEYKDIYEILRSAIRWQKRLMDIPKNLKK